ncbi:MAG: PIN domain-containing protein [Lachnospiraceae bacterium]|nr:PIN domain-containing protein [Lachnospiraceae bacterium]
MEPWRSIARHNIKETAEIIKLAERLREEGIKTFDALHIACAVNAGCDYFLSTDRKLLNHKVDGISIVDPVKFISEQEVE